MVTVCKGWGRGEQQDNGELQWGGQRNSGAGQDAEPRHTDRLSAGRGAGHHGHQQWPWGRVYHEKWVYSLFIWQAELEFWVGYLAATCVGFSSACRKASCSLLSGLLHQK